MLLLMIIMQLRAVIISYLDQHCQNETVNIEKIDGSGVFGKSCL